MNLCEIKFYIVPERKKRNCKHENPKSKEIIMEEKLKNKIKYSLD